ncbi:kelch-like protein 42 [Ambystoma mexicanum]|uniref:kelch-like protein 42 n=1 Tax=Ambystoma mexicanum TaxID=8296 RepID=UPI0037E829F9
MERDAVQSRAEAPRECGSRLRCRLETGEPRPPASMSSEETIRITLGDKCYEVCKSRLIERSDYFRALYSSGMKESQPGQSVQLQGLSVPGLELVIEFINTSQVTLEQETLEDLVESASFLQVTSMLELLLSRVQLDNCVELCNLGEVYGTQDLRDACLEFMACNYHQLLQRPEFHLFPTGFRQQVREMRMKGDATLIALGDFIGTPFIGPHQEGPWSMMRFDEAAQRWLPMASSLPPSMVNVRGYGSAVMDNYLFIVGGFRMSSQEISAAHCYNPCKNEWKQIASMNQKRSNFKLLAVNGKLYAIGGQALSNVECYSPEHDWWTFVASLPSPLAEFSACECQGRIYVIGGYTSKDRNLSILQYCPTADSWTVFEHCNLHVRKQQMLSVEDTIYLVGGCIHELDSSKKTCHSEDMLTVQSYNISTREWLYLKGNTSKSGLNLTCSLHNDGIYIMSRDLTLTTSLEHRVFLKYNLFADSWEPFRRFPATGQNMLLCSLYVPKSV